MAQSPPRRKKQRVSDSGRTDLQLALHQWRQSVPAAQLHQPRKVKDGHRHHCASCNQRTQYGCTSSSCEGAYYCIKPERVCFTAYHMGQSLEYVPKRRSKSKPWRGDASDDESSEAPMSPVI